MGERVMEAGGGEDGGGAAAAGEPDEGEAVVLT